MLVGEICLETNNVRQLVDFYKEVLKISSDEDNDVHQTLFTEGVMLSVYNDGTVKNNQNRNISLAFTVDDVDAEFDRLLELGVTIIDPPTTRPWGARNMHFTDPDGNHIYFRSLPK